MMWKRIFGIGLLACLLSPVAPAGSIFTEGVDPKKFTSTIGKALMGARVGARFKAAHWTGRTGRTFVQHFPTLIDAEQVGALIAPPGEWVDVVFDLDGPVTLSARTNTGGSFSARLAVSQWSVALDEPLFSDGTVAMQVELTLPDWVADKVAAAPGQDLFVDSGSSLYQALVVAFQDGAIAR